MMRLDHHPTVTCLRALQKTKVTVRSETLDVEQLRQICLDAGADDVGFVEIDRPEMAHQREHILRAFPPAKTLISFVLQMNRKNVRSPARSIANLEFHDTADQVNQVARRIVKQLDALATRAINGGAMGFPMEMDRWPEQIWVVSHKPVAVAAGLGHMGIHRNVIHPKFGNFILLGTVIAEAQVNKYSTPIDYNPCLECKLCVAACPTGAIQSDGRFSFSACYTHNYREFMGGFTDWAETVVDSPNAKGYRKKVTDSETVSLWQSLGFCPNYKAAYCMSVCPAGEDVIAPFLDDRQQFLQDVVKPMQNKPETVYVVPGPDAEDHLARRFPHKRSKRVGNGSRPRTIRGFLQGLPWVFQAGRSKGLDVTYHFTFTGEEPCQATVVIRETTLQVMEGHRGSPDLKIKADSLTWLGFLAKERHLIWALLARKIRLQGPPRLFLAFGRCFPS